LFAVPTVSCSTSARPPVPKPFDRCSISFMLPSPSWLPSLWHFGTSFQHLVCCFLFPVFLTSARLLSQYLLFGVPTVSCSYLYPGSLLFRHSFPPSVVLFLVTCLFYLCSTPGPKPAAPVLCGIRSAWCRRDHCFFPLPKLPVLPSVSPCSCSLFLWF
jgi:hypothetical protein